MKGQVYRPDGKGFPSVFAVKDEDGTFAVFELMEPRPPEGHPRLNDWIEWDSDQPGRTTVQNLTRGESYLVLAQDFNLSLERLKATGLFRIDTE